nr:hypothetical protein HK105_004365 [Polyrhizophydium stewartii]
MSGGTSGGTVASAVGIVSSLSTNELLELRSNANYAVPEAEASNMSTSIAMTFDQDFQAWQGPHPMETPNTRIVHRTKWLLGYGTDFSYSEGMRCSSYAAALAVTAGMSAMAVSMWLPPSRWLVQSAIPPGSGPSDEAIKSGHFNIEIIGASHPDDNGVQHKARAIVKGVQDPGYGESSKMISESAICLALDRAKFATPGATGSLKTLIGGVATTASSMGMLLVNRLRAAGMTFDVADL